MALRKVPNGRKVNSVSRMVAAKDIAEVYNRFKNQYASLPETTPIPTKYYLVNYVLNQALKKGSF